MIPFTVFAPLAGAFCGSLVAPQRDDRKRPGARRSRTWFFARTAARKISGLHIYAPRCFLSSGRSFEAAKNACRSNITGEARLARRKCADVFFAFPVDVAGRGTRRLDCAHVGYPAAFIVNAVSFVLSALSVWFIPEHETKQLALEKDLGGTAKRASYWSDIREGWAYIISHAPVAAILLINVVWA